ncbi:MAG: 30S ribosomal protein S20 [Candidatus Omnitrophica bacterium]|nr:30S ribosomal protein S20 [Candidatus Omnitrophota bacterium]
MPRRKASVKRIRVDKKRKLHNLKIKQQLKKTLKKFNELLSAKNIEEAKKQIQKVYSSLDKAAKKKIIHPNLASRKKSRLSKRLLKTHTA